MNKKEKKQDLQTLRHSAAHVLAQAVLQMFPEAKLAIGPSTDEGFYYDFDLPRTLIPEDLDILEKKMKDIIKADYQVKPEEVVKEKALDFYKKGKQVYKRELINDIPKKKVYFYRQNDFVDLCAGPHVKSTGEIKAFKLLKIAGAYWRGDEKRPMLQRIYGTVFYTQKELEEYLKNLEEAKKRDHRRLGKDLDLFVFSDLVGQGLPLFTPKGTIIRQEMQKYSSELRKEIDYQEVSTQEINKGELFKISGHYEKYKEDMFQIFSHHTKEEYFLKPMNCPQHTQIYASKIRSYKDLPYKVADFSMIYRDEKPGEVGGLTRVRGFEMDDGHCFCREDQIEAEFDKVLKAIKKALKTYGMDFYVRLSLRDPKEKAKYLGDDQVWNKSEKILEKIAKDNKISYEIGIGEAAFYGPKMDIMAKDALNREHQISTIQLDFNMPKRFNLSYASDDGKNYMPVMIHSALIGSIDRFLGVLIEHYAGAFPAWLAPVQVIIIPISDKKHLKYAKEISKNVLEKDIRVEIDSRPESVGKKIREAELQKIPYMFIVGDKEIKAKKISVRNYKKGDLGQKSLKFIDDIKQEIDKRQG
ncbi:threonine--tRNA ligase [bacterium CG_4_10_14_0_2_um_filter_33_32]|nr:MAG: threonine--tRNA ligase [bacterium CG2_30_33_46]PIR67785.1 MAG: threonine--tRNA ligase [bacterium CG10_big_fil_rev_8_21_14_0_10_33_18]PIU76811.1 MAG: threonine--tRNA ligase [bacterium CG06_land_8_20_14_3_00_33_50]PIW81611.1 MAG: threonine--tRNA ligase [bacterium CG_4_8_14_3_um_filter_33_28]PIY85531.1 MAG: threonine--tRNA ligase [bacterium CG_4_10_14_0_8_um_filter_33_57]PIZ85510.1 MAG: threonine--tRNA ligase [bacterium CG_4_10_14_0_2_um_filter_33_32]PJA72361.1 MAG: threonine--tRNA ligas